MATFPQKLGRYVLERRLAAGGMAEVFYARQSGPEGFEKVCVVKRMLPHLTDDEVFVNMFLDEARLAARLTHPNVAQVFDFGRNDDAYYLAMEYVPGSNLHFVVDDHTRRGSRLPLAPVLRITALACAGLDFAHNAADEKGQPLNIVHRDISPHNIMLSTNGDVKLIDFGIAKAAVGLNQTKAGTLKGKYAYMAPEQVLGKTLDRRTDIYAMGLVLYELLAGRPAITGDSEALLMGAAARREFAPIETIRSDVPTDVRAVLDKALALNVNDRYATAGAMADDIEDYLARSGTRVRQNELTGLLTSSTAATSVGPSARVLATPSNLALGDATDVAPTQKAAAPTVEQRAVTVPEQTAIDGASGPTTAQAIAEVKPRRILPALAIVLLMGATGITVFAVTRAGSSTVTVPAETLLVPPPPPKPMVEPEQTEVAKFEPEAKPPVEAPVDVPAKAQPAQHETVRPKHPKEPKEPKSVAAADASAKGTVVFRVLPYGEVFLDGKSLGVTPLKPMELAPGKYEFKIVNPETKKSESREVTIAHGAQSTVKVDLR